MAEKILELVFTIVGVYLLVGFAFALVFVSFGAARIDPGAKNTSLWFKLIILPGASLLWPLLAFRWFSGQSDTPTEKINAHRNLNRNQNRNPI